MDNRFGWHNSHLGILSMMRLIVHGLTTFKSGKTLYEFEINFIYVSILPHYNLKYFNVTDRHSNKSLTHGKSSVWYQTFSAFPEMALHHLVVLACFGASVLKRMFLGLTMVAMLMEVNSIFLHSRTLCLYSGLKNTYLYRVVSISNILSMIVFRLMVSYFPKIKIQADLGNLVANSVVRRGKWSRC